MAQNRLLLILLQKEFRAKVGLSTKGPESEPTNLELDELVEAAKKMLGPQKPPAATAAPGAAAADGSGAGTGV